MKDEYIIINKTALLKRIEELEKTSAWETENYGELKTLKQIISQSTPLIPEIEKAFNEGSERDEYGYDNANDKNLYISNLKLDI